MALLSVLPLTGQQLCEGDLLFCCSDSMNAITAVNDGVENLPIEHVGVVHRVGGNNGALFVIEAIKPEVCLTPIDSFLYENVGVVLVGRINVDCDMSASVSRCLAMVGKPYDDLYLPGDSAVYCSELVQMNFVNHEGALIFTSEPLSFHDATGCITDYWRDFYAQRGMSVPEGLPGSHPGTLSRSPQITIITRYPARNPVKEKSKKTGD